MNNNILERVNFLKDEINKHNYLYYVEDNPSISDYDYDMMFKVPSAKNFFLMFTNTDYTALITPIIMKI